MTTPVYESEETLVQTLLLGLFSEASPWGPVRVRREFDYQRGRTDVVALTSSGSVVAFEAKLTRWRVALHQAYRNLCFADVSFVVLPKKAAIRAASFSRDFDRRGVGICYVSDDEGVIIVYDADVSEPLQPWLRAAAIDSISRTPGS